MYKKVGLSVLHIQLFLHTNWFASVSSPVSEDNDGLCPIRFCKDEIKHCIYSAQ